MPTARIRISSAAFDEITKALSEDRRDADIMDVNTIYADGIVISRKTEELIFKPIEYRQAGGMSLKDLGKESSQYVAMGYRLLGAPIQYQNSGEFVQWLVKGDK